MFKKLFTIKYNNKDFLILVDNNHRKTFLEITKNGEYIYPEYEDYKNLFEIYNNYDYTIKYNKNVTYKEKVRYKSMLLVASVILSAEIGYIGKRIIELDDIDKNTLSIAFQRMYKDETHNRSDIDLFYDNEVITREDVVNVINNNENLNDYYKKIAIEVLDLNLELDPDINLRIYYENMKNLKIVIESWDIISKNNKEKTAGYFSSVDKSIHLLDTYANYDNTVAHEFTHAMHDLIDSSKKEILHINETIGFSLEEAMTNRIVTNRWGNQSTYDFQQRMLSFLIDNVDNFNYHTYNEFGIMGLIMELKEKYSDVDIDYIIDYIDTYTQSYYKINNVQHEPFDNIDFCSELFKITVNNIDKDDLYKSFDTFMNLFDKDTYNNYYNKYIRLYNNYLNNNKESIVNTR